MVILYSEHFRRNYRNTTVAVQKACDKQLRYLENDLHHPSLHAKKYDERNGIWQARVNKNWRFYFLIGNGTITLLDIIVHPN